MSSDDAARQLATELPDGYFDAIGHARIPEITPALYERLLALSAEAFGDTDRLLEEHHGIRDNG